MDCVTNIGAWHAYLVIYLAVLKAPASVNSILMATQFLYNSILFTKTVVKKRTRTYPRK
jgi:hypothetical protein